MAKKQEVKRRHIVQMQCAASDEYSYLLLKSVAGMHDIIAKKKHQLITWLSESAITLQFVIPEDSKNFDQDSKMLARALSNIVHAARREDDIKIQCQYIYVDED